MLNWITSVINENSQVFPISFSLMFSSILVYNIHRIGVSWKCVQNIYFLGHFWIGFTAFLFNSMQNGCTANNPVWRNQDLAPFNNRTLAERTLSLLWCTSGSSLQVTHPCSYHCSEYVFRQVSGQIKLSSCQVLLNDAFLIATAVVIFLPSFLTVSEWMLVTHLPVYVANSVLCNVWVTC